MGSGEETKDDTESLPAAPSSYLVSSESPWKQESLLFHRLYELKSQGLVAQIREVFLKSIFDRPQIQVWPLRMNPPSFLSKCENKLLT